MPLPNFFSEDRKKRGLSILFPSERKAKFSIPRSIPTSGTSAVGSGLVSTSQENEISHSSDGKRLTLARLYFLRYRPMQTDANLSHF